MTQQNIGSWQPAYQQAGNLYGQASQTMPQGIQDYMNPYTNAVVNRIGELGTRNLSEQLLPQVNSTFTGTGQFGSTRNADFTNRALRDVNENILAQQNAALNTGYQNAAQNFTTDMNRLGNLGNQFMNFGQSTSQLGGQDASTMMNLGNIQKAEDQQSLDLAYNQFLEQRDYPKTQLEFMNSIVRGLPVTKSAFNTQTNLPTYNQASMGAVSPLSAIGQMFGNAASTSQAFGG